MTEPMLTARMLNRTLLARQHLLERRSDDPIAVMREMAGLQTQYSPSGYLGLRSRVRDLARPTLTRLLEERHVVQGTMMRGTIHMVPASDYWPAIAGIGRINREWYARVQAGEIGATDLAAVAAAIREELTDGPMRFVELSTRIAARGFPVRAASWAQLWLPLLRVPPSGTWERPRADRYALAEQWLPPGPVPISEEEGRAHLVRRYLGGFGPARLRDIASWMGVTVGQLRPVVDGLGLRPFRDEAGKPLLDLPDAPIAEPDRPAPPRFLAVWDAILLVHARRTGVLAEEHRPRIFSVRNPQSVHTFLLDGQVAGAWRWTDGEIRLEPFRRLAVAERAALEDEAHRLAAFHR